MKTFNQVILLGNLGRDAESRFTPGGDARTTFSVATNRRVKEGEGHREETEWTNCVLWKNEGVVPYLVKGQAVLVQGSLQTRKWETPEGEKRYMTEIVVRDLVLVGGSEGEKVKTLVSSPRGAGSASASLEITDEDIPF